MGSVVPSCDAHSWVKRRKTGAVGVLADPERADLVELCLHVPSQNLTHHRGCSRSLLMRSAPPSLSTLGLPLPIRSCAKSCHRTRHRCIERCRVGLFVSISIPVFSSGTGWGIQGGLNLTTGAVIVWSGHYVESSGWSPPKRRRRLIRYERSVSTTRRLMRKRWFAICDVTCIRDHFMLSLQLVFLSSSVPRCEDSVWSCRGLTRKSPHHELWNHPTAASLFVAFSTKQTT
jgi:hypothetical protein